MSKKIERKDRHFKFETLQLHINTRCPSLRSFRIILSIRLLEPPVSRIFIDVPLFVTFQMKIFSQAEIPEPQSAPVSLFQSRLRDCCR